MASDGHTPPSIVDWEAVARFVRSVQARNEYTKEHHKSVKSLVKASELRPILFGLTVSSPPSSFV